MSPADRDIILTVNEFDAMAVHQGCKKTALTLPAGPDPERIDTDVRSTAMPHV